MSAPVVIGSERSEVGLPAAVDVLRPGGSALDAVEVALQACEDDLADHHVGSSVLPTARGGDDVDDACRQALADAATDAVVTTATTEPEINPRSVR